MGSHGTDFAGRLRRTSRGQDGQDAERRRCRNGFPYSFGPQAKFQVPQILARFGEILPGT